MKKNILLLMFLLSSAWTKAQSYYFATNNTTPVETLVKPLPHAWAGGLNASQFNTIDLNGNGMEDLVVFDRSTNRATVYLATSTATGFTWVYHPELETVLPRLEGWALFRDYDGDGLKDIFTEVTLSSSGKGIRVFKNTGPADGIPRFNLIAAELSTTSFAGNPIPLQVTTGDLPAIVDADGDGDLDVLVFEFSGGSVEFHQNMSKENTGSTSQLSYQKVTGCWGRFYEGSTCGQFDFNIECRPGQASGPNDQAPLGTKHVGSTITALDINNSGALDLLIGDVGCSNLSLLYNTGTPQSPLISRADTNFPRNSRKVNLFVFPAAFYEDVTFDGKKDLLVSVNTTVNESNMVNFHQSNWLYTNQSSGPAPEFVYQSNDFLQADMIDLGENANPAFADVDGDGDLDLLVGNYGKRFRDGSFYATLALFDNIGTNTAPAFRLVNEDYLGLSSFRYTRLKPVFVDLNADGSTDIAFVNAYSGTISDIKYVLNTAPQGAALQFSTNNIQRLPLSIGTEDSPAFYDMDQDGKVDILLAKHSGKLQYYRNTGSNEAPQYTLVKDNYGGIANNLQKTNPKILLADLDNNHSPELVIGDRSGLLSIYSDITNSTDSVLVPSTHTLYDSLQHQLMEAKLSSFYLSPAVADLNNDGHPEIVLGTRGGGLIFLQNLAGNPLKAVKPITHKTLAEIYPNPAAGEVQVSAYKEANLSILSLTGQVVVADYLLKAAQPQTIDLSNFKPGLYIVRIRSVDGQVQVKKLVVH